MLITKGLGRLREAILADVREDCQVIDELSDWHYGLIEAWNAIPGVEPITDADLVDEDGAPCCPDPGCQHDENGRCTFPGYADNH